MDYRIVLAVTGGGTRILPRLFARPGASSLMLEATVPYHPDSLRRYVGGPVEQSCGEATARRLAVAAFERARELINNDTNLPQTAQPLGVGCTAALATDRVRRGDDRAFVAVHSLDRTLSGRLGFGNQASSRDFQEDATADLIAQAIQRFTDTPSVEPKLLASSATDAASAAGRIIWRESVAQPGWRELAMARTPLVVIPPSATSQIVLQPISKQLLLPGSFNPPHPGHLRMLEIAQRVLGREPSFELSILNADKPPLDYLTIEERVARLQQTRLNVYLTSAPRFIDKATLFPESTFIVGADTAQRIIDPRFYDGSEAARDRVLSQLAKLGCRFLLFGRLVGGVYQAAEQLELPQNFRQMCDYISEDQFRLDISSTQLRGQ